MRLDGNDVVHEADKPSSLELVRDASVLGDVGPDVAILKNISGCIYGEVLSLRIYPDH